MKKLISVAILCLLLCMNALAGDVVDISPLEQSIGSEADEMLDGYDIKKADVKDGASRLLNGFTSALREQLKKAGINAFMVLIVCALISIADAFSKSNELAVSSRVLDIFALCTLLLISFGSFNSVIHQCTRAIESLGSFWKVLVPVFATATAVAGSPASAISSAGATLLFSGILTDVAAKLIIPSILIYIGAGAAAAVIQNSLLSGLSEVIKWCSISFYKCFLTLFTIYISLSGVITGSADAVAVRTAQATITGVLPVLGGVVSDTSEAILSGAAVLKGAVGIYGFLAACTICLLPFVSALAQFLAYRILGMVASSLAGGVSGKIISIISDGYGIAIGLLGTCCAVQFISIVVSTVVINR